VVPPRDFIGTKDWLDALAGRRLTFAAHARHKERIIAPATHEMHSEVQHSRIAERVFGLLQAGVFSTSALRRNFNSNDRDALEVVLQELSKAGIIASSRVPRGVTWSRVV
jgi:hypothetical protein